MSALLCPVQAALKLRAPPRLRSNPSVASRVTARSVVRLGRHVTRASSSPSPLIGGGDQTSSQGVAFPTSPEMKASARVEELLVDVFDEASYEKAMDEVRREVT